MSNKHLLVIFLSFFLEKIKKINPAGFHQYVGLSIWRLPYKFWALSPPISEVFLVAIVAKPAEDIATRLK